MVAWVLVAHVFGFVLWISGLVAAAILLVQLIGEGSPDARRALARVQTIILRALVDPGATVTIVAGIVLIATNSSYYLHARWLHIKLGFVVILIVLHVLIAIRSKAAAAGRAVDSTQAKVLLALVLLVFLSILIATLPGEVFLT